MKWFAKKVFDGGGKDLKNQYNSIRYCFKNIKYFVNQITTFLKPRRERKSLNSKGAILIEFAVCMPVLIILLFYIHDLVKIKRYYSQTEFVAQQFVNIIQNISQKREDKKITLKDLKHALSVAWLTIYPGKTMYSTGSYKHEFIHFPYVMIYYVKGEANGKASCIWEYSLYSYGCIAPPFDNNGKSTSDLSYSHIRWGSSVPPSTIYPTLKISEGEEKVIIDSNLWWRTGDKDNTGNTVKTSREAFKFYLVSPKVTVPYGSAAYFNSVVIFTPKPGLFSETAPS